MQSLATPDEIDYERDVQPLLDRYCVACHACFDAPCQLDLTHPDGVERGASKQRIYDATRLEASEPSRLHIDADSVAQWRERGFFDVLGRQQQVSILRRVLDARPKASIESGEALPDDVVIGIKRANRCSAPAEIKAALAEDPHLAMPFAMPPMPADDLATLRSWLDMGAPIAITKPVVDDRAAAQIAAWERWLNDPRPRRALVARWLFEHWVIARLHFAGSGTGPFYRIVRSRTPTGKAVDEIATRFSNSDPGGRFYYRFRPQTGTRVYKTHIRFELSSKLRHDLERWFFTTDWSLQTLPGYSDGERANPFTTFAAIPPEARYRFMLEHAGYFVRTFIRGPVCRGELATDVIRDHFWVMFQSPDSDPYIEDAAYRARVDPLLALPGIEDDLLDGAEQWFSASADRNRYVGLRQAALETLLPGGANIDAIWDGEGNNVNALLTVFRHHDSATVRRGWVGQLPLTVWWMDYPLFERSYYNLVVNFDVFGSLAHQVQTRLYFDLIRNGAEQNFLQLLPRETRQAVLDVWYAGSGQIKLWLGYRSIDTTRPSAIRFSTDDPKRELLVLTLRRLADVNASPDPINRPGGRKSHATDVQWSQLAGKTAEQLPAIAHLPEASLVRVMAVNGERRLYTLIRNRRHANVAFVLGESLRYEPEKDTLSIVPGVATGYPNFIFTVPADELEPFVATLGRAGTGKHDRFVRDIVERWGVRRTDPAAWTAFHDVYRYQVETEPLEAGWLDLNRYIDY